MKEPRRSAWHAENPSPLRTCPSKAEEPVLVGLGALSPHVGPWYHLGLMIFATQHPVTLPAVDHCSEPLP